MPPAAKPVTIRTGFAGQSWASVGADPNTASPARAAPQTSAVMARTIIPCPPRIAIIGLSPIL
jgi:hypothetical protein